MPYITSVEEIGYDRGLEVGVRSTALRQIARRFGTIEASIVNQIEILPVEELDDLTDIVFDAKSIADIIVWLNNI